MVHITPTETTAKVQALDDFVNSDLKAERKEYLFDTPVLTQQSLSLLKDERDLPMVSLQLNILQVLIPGVATVFYVNTQVPGLSLFWRNIVGLAYIVTLDVLFLERFILMMHFAAHRSIFKINALNEAVTWVLAPFFGIPCGLYKLHHVVMHHIENNHKLDISSTEPYQRDSLPHFLFYWFRFAVLIWVELPHYAARTKRWDWFRQTVFGLCLWCGIIFMLARYVSMCATVWVFIVPHYLSITAMAFGNWSQHIFINPEKPASNFGLTYNCIDTPGNQTTWNDGYHVIHHLNARLHWSELPRYFHENRQKHRENGALTFRGVHFFDVGIMVMTGQLQKLAEKHYVHLGGQDTAPSTEEVVKMLKSWLAPVTQEAVANSKKD
mmetsp:Transcript_11959/g.27969  ORF Transcript_11959/g.27969 Transcript_11959/m.27969 type:complete len:381 (-) Transcript_11959:158-1300(-)|eukprot:CAMPEP_0178403676 /NCGR_PEP_ID=MMETSP0689_2-20121128/17493_1 /TAXON_ID=160604 /ORGANISM="Amphidinium massartii, Strain CS-259" /LENGTH=380 /DNA_ID=CAMNT_0020024641 /DNA_START=66 /DNA_END=1208 /DNA_ORIENTATION=-